MGFRAALEYAAKIHDLSHTVPSAKQFFETRREKGLKAALEERDGKFGNLRGSGEARQRREKG